MAEPTSWSPKFEEQTIRDLIGQYQMNPRLFDDKDEDIEVLENHATHYNIPFARTDEHQRGFVSKVIRNLGKGFIEGFSTLPVGKDEPPEDTTEAISRSLGHLAGFVGYLPGARALKFFKFRKAAGVVSALRGKSAPMLAGSYATKKVTKALEPFLDDLPKFARGDLIADMASGAFSLGVASSVSSWTHGIEEMWKSAGFGFVAGGVFRGIGNLSGFGEKIRATQMKPNGSPDMSKLSAGQKADLTARTLAGSLYMGLPSTLQDATTEEQIYAYLLGAHFGYKEMPFSARISREMIADSERKGSVFPQEHKRWEKLTPDMKEIVKEDFNKWWGPEESRAAIRDLTKDRDFDDETLEQLFGQYQAGYEYDANTGKWFKPGAPKEEIKEYVNEMKKSDRVEDTQDLDMHEISLKDMPGAYAYREGWIDRVFKDSTPVEKTKAKLEIWERWKKLIDEDFRPLPGAEDEIVEWVAAKYGKDIKYSEASWWRARAESERKQVPVEQIEVRNGEVGIMQGRTNSLGNQKSTRQEPPLIEQIFQQLHLEQTGELYQGNFTRVLDHMVLFNKEFDLARVVDGVKTEFKDKNKSWTWARAEQASKNYVDKMYTKVFEQMHQDGYYYIGGKGDAKRMYFAKLHPLLDVTDKIEAPKLSNTIGVSVMRDSRYGNPFIVPEVYDKSPAHYQKLGFVRAESRADAIQSYEDWIRGTNYKTFLPEKRNKILKSLKSGQLQGGYGKPPLMYFKPDAKDSHAVRLQKLIVEMGPRKSQYTDAFFERVNMILGRTQKGVSENYRKSLERWKKEFPKLSEDMYKDMYVSNILYDLSFNAKLFNNGKLTKETLPKFLRDLDRLLPEVLEEGYINTPKQYNKRAQIWLNTGLSANPRYIKASLKKMYRNERNPEKRKILKDTYEKLDEDQGFRVGFFKDVKEKEKYFESDPALLYPETSDGAIIARRELVDALNQDKGLPFDGATNKSFIVSPHKTDGTLLGKYMIHAASPKLDAYMRKNDLHMMVPQSAVKQVGSRKLGNLYIDNGQIKYSGEQDIIPIEHFRTITSEITTSKSLKDVMIPKQLYSTLASRGYKDIDPEVMRDMFVELSERAVNGTEYGIKVLNDYKNKPNDETINRIIQNIDEVPMREVLKIMRDTKQKEASTLIYKKLLREQDDYLRDLAEEGDISRGEMEIVRNESSEYQNIVKIMSDLFPEGSLVPYLHKFSKDYRMQTIRNWVVKRLTRPRVQNSISARMRPWDIGLQINEVTKKLGEPGGDKYYFLDEGHREKWLYDPVFSGGREKLGEVWDRLQANKADYGLNRGTVENIIEALVMRTPMDSISGAHVLRFGGFTGVDGYSILLHPRSMKALGGADLDGDKAHIFLGGETTGFRQSWKKMYNDSKNEYLNVDKSEKHNKDSVDPVLKETYRRIFAIADDKMVAESQHISSQYTPYWRYFMSRGAFEGRDGLAIAVTSKQSILGAYDSIRNAPSEETTQAVPYRDINGNVLKDKNNNPIMGRMIIKKDSYSVPFYFEASATSPPMRKYITFTVKKGAQDLQRFREMARAAIALGSDPMDEAGIRIDMFKPYLLDTLFKYKVENVKGKRLVLDRETTRQLNSHKENTGWNSYEILRLKRFGLHTNFGRVNSVLFSRNFQEGRIFTYPEIQEGVRSLDFLPPESRTTFIPMLANKMKEMDWSDNVYRRMDIESVNDVYEKYRGFVKEHDYLKEVLGRKSLSSSKGEFLDTIIRKKLWIPANVERLAKDDIAWNNFFNKKRYDAGVEIPIFPKRKKLSELDRETFEKRKRFIEETVLQGEDYLVNDLSDMATLKIVADTIKRYNIPHEVVGEIHAKADALKTLGAQYAKRRKAIDDIVNRKDVKDRDIRGILGEDKLSAEVDQMRIDKSIRKYKKNLDSTGERALFDYLYLGTYQRGDSKRLEALKGIKHQETKEALKPVIKALEKAFHNTSLVRAGVLSKAVSDSSKKNFFLEYEKLFKSSMGEYSKEEKVQLERELKGEKEEITEFRDKDGVFTEGQLVDANKLSETDRYYLDNLAPFKGIFDAPGKIKDPEISKVYYQLKNHLEHYHQLDNRNLNGFFRGIFGKDINLANKQDLLTLNRILEDMRDGTWFRKAMDWFTGKKKGLPSPKKSYWWMFPKAIDRDLMRSKAMVEFVDDIGPYKDRLGNTIDNARIVRPTSIIGKIQQLAHRTQELSMRKGEEEVDKFEDELKPYVAAQKDGDILYQIAVRGKGRELSYMRTELKARNKGKSGNHTEEEMNYQTNWDEVKADWDIIKDKEYIIPTKKGRQRMTGRKVVENINRIITKFNKRVHSWMVGDEQEYSKWLRISEDRNGNVTPEGLNKLRKKFIKKVMDSVRKNEDIAIEKLGIDGMRQIIKRIQVSYITRNSKMKILPERILDMIKVEPYEVTGEIRSDFYYPHLGFNRKKAGESLKRAWSKIAEDPFLTKEERTAELKKVFHQYQTLTGDFISRDDMGENFRTMHEVANEWQAGREKRAKQILSSSLKRVGNQFSRQGHLPGWDTTPEAYISYMKNVINAFHKQAMQASANTIISDFDTRFRGFSGDNKVTNAWKNFFQLYTQSAMGYPTHIPERVMNDPLMKIKGTPYKWLADSTVKKRLDYIGKKLGVNRKELEKMNLNEKLIDELSGVEYTAMQRWSALEAKWQLASLLAHPKSSIANLYGGTVHTWINTGWENLKKARNFDYLKTNINPEWESMKDVEKWLQKLGVIEEFLIYEAGLNPELKNKKWEGFQRDVVRKLKKDPNMADDTLFSLAKQHNISRRLFDKAAAFMRIPERILRRDAFMAHYIQASNNFGGAIKDFNSPFLIKMAKQGVKGTQFLYSAPFRPMWTNSALGRVFARFQLWSWNAVRFRNDVVSRAHEHGWREGTKEFDAFVRLAQADLFMYGLSSIFLYSLFENSLPAPWNWFQDTADWFFGDENEKDRAFYGSVIGPFQAVTPPALRLLPPMFKWMISGDSSRLTDYYLWTVPPFGRLIRDVVGPGGAIENPYYAVTKFTGLPILQLGSLTDREDKPLGGKFIY